MPLHEEAFRRAQERASLAVATDQSDRPSVIYDRALIAAYLGDKAIEDSMLAEYTKGVSPTARHEMMRLLQAIGAGVAP